MLREPQRLRLAICVLTLAGAYFGVYLPLAERINQASRLCHEAQQRQTTAHEVQLLKAQAALFQPRLSSELDTNELIEYVLSGVRELPLQLVQVDAAGTESLGPYQTLKLQMEVRGEVSQLDAFIAWLETNPWFFRIDALRLDPPRGQNTVASLRLVLRALKG